MASVNPSSSSTNSRDSIAYVNGRVYTVNPAQPWIEAFIVGPDGNISAVGTTSEITAQAHRDRMTIFNLRNRFIMPGIHDAHLHLLYSGLANTSQIRLPEQGLSGANLAEELKKGQCLCKYTHVNEDWLVGHAYMVEDFDRQKLDEEFPNTPVIIRGGAGHNAYLNSEALRRSGYNAETEPNTQGTRYWRDEQTGHLTGEMAENSMNKAMTTLPKASLPQAKRCLLNAISSLHRAGVTSCQEASTGTLMLRAFRSLEEEGALKMDIHAHIVYAPDWIAEESPETLHKTLDKASTYASKHVDTRFVKIILDGVPLPPLYTHAALDPNDPTKIDPTNLLVTNVQEAVHTYDARNMTVKIHCTGHGATRLAMDAFESVRSTNPSGPRHEIAHCSGVHPDEYKRFQPLNVTAEMSPAFFFKHPVTESSGGLMDWNFREMLRHNAHLTIGSDWGAGPNPDILPCLVDVVGDVGDGDMAKGGEMLIRMMTLAGAEAVGREKEFGSIEVGKKGNFIAVDRDLSKGEFEGCRVLRTWFEGEIVFEVGEE